jgi:hypothetical protein
MLVKLCPIEGEVCAELLTSRGRDRASAKRKHLRPDHFVGAVVAALLAAPVAVHAQGVIRRHAARRGAG